MKPLVASAIRKHQTVANDLNTAVRWRLGQRRRDQSVNGSSRTKLPLLLLFLLSIHTLGHAQVDEIPSPRDSLILRGIHFTICQEYDSAQTCFARIVAEYPKDPAGTFFKSAALQARMMDLETDEQEDEFYALANKTISLARDRLRRQPRDAWALFYLGAAHAYKAFYLARNGKYLQGFHSGRRCLEHLQQAVAADSTLYDAYLGIGSYKYWRSSLTEFLSWLPFIGDEREEGIEMIKLAIEKGKYSRTTAINDLTWILIDAKRFDEAAQLTERGLSEYPDSRFFLWPAAEIDFRTGKFSRAVVHYEKILESLLAEEQVSRYNEIVCRLRLAEAHIALGHYGEARDHCQEIMGFELDKKTRNRAKGKLKQARKLLERCEDLTSESKVSQRPGSLQH